MGLLRVRVWPGLAPLRRGGCNFDQCFYERGAAFRAEVGQQIFVNCCRLRYSVFDVALALVCQFQDRAACVGTRANPMKKTAFFKSANQFRDCRSVRSCRVAQVGLIDPGFAIDCVHDGELTWGDSDFRKPRGQELVGALSGQVK